jgi:hypothetical protein
VTPKEERFNPVGSKDFPIFLTERSLEKRPDAAPMEEEATDDGEEEARPALSPS